MKDNSSLINTKTKETQKLLITSPSQIILKKKEAQKNFSPKISITNSYKNLVKSNIVKLNIIKSHLTLFEAFQTNRFLTKSEISLINEIKEKYASSSLSILDNMDKVPNKPIPLIMPNNQYNYYNKNYFKNFNKINQKIFSNDNYNYINENNFLNQKRERTLSESLINKIKTKSESDGDKNQESNSTPFKKKAIFQLFKKKSKLKYEFYKGQKTPGRKKKNSGEVGTHNKFSKDNMMRKLKNKVMESARKLINKKIKDESNSELKYFKEIRKIEGVYSQELNIKFNFWFYFQKLKDIFQFKMSSKYSKGGLDSNFILINKIYSPGKAEHFQKTIQLLEMPFYQYYHDIFLGENENWLTYFDIKEKENKYQLEYFVNDNNSNKENDFIKYRNTIFKLAYNYEKFFLEKNPRVTSNKNTEKPSNVKEIIKYINNSDNEMFKMKFIQQASFYRPELSSYINIVLSNKNNINDINFNKRKNNLLENYQNIIKKEINKNINNDKNGKNSNEKKVNEYDNNNINNINNSNKDKNIIKNIKGGLFRIEKIKKENINNLNNLNNLNDLNIDYNKNEPNKNDLLTKSNELIQNNNINCSTNNSNTNNMNMSNVSAGNKKESENEENESKDKDKDKDKESTVSKKSDMVNIEIFI